MVFFNLINYNYQYCFNVFNVFIVVVCLYITYICYGQDCWIMQSICESLNKTIIKTNKLECIDMIELFQDRRIFVNQKRKQLHRNPLPQIKYHMTLVKKNHDNPYPHNQPKSQSSNIILFNNFQPLSSILISKRICPSNNPQTISKKTLQKPMRQLLNNARRQSLRGIAHFSQCDSSKQSDGLVGSQLVKLMEESNSSNGGNGGGKRNSTSLTYRIRTRQRESNRVVIENLSTGLDEMQQLQLRSKPTIIRAQQNPLYFLIPKANNNQDLIRQILLSRGIWRQVKPSQQVPHLKWIFSKQRYNYKKMFSYTQKKLVNHFEFNQQISTKDNLVRNLQLYCQTKKMEVFNITPVTFIIDFDDQYCQYNIKQFLGFFVKHDPRRNNVGNGSGGSNKKIVNQFNLVNSFMGKFQPFMSWQNSDIKKKVNILSRPINNSSYYSQNSYLWLLKPTGLNRGRGIEIFDSIQTLQKMLMSFLQHLQRKKFTQTNNNNENMKKKGKGEKEKQREKKDSVIKQKQQTPSSVKFLQNSICLTSQSQSKQHPPPPHNTQSPLGNDHQQQQQQQQPTTTTTQQSPTKACRQKFKLNTCSFVIQKYVQKPFLIQGRKFDIRVWALLTHKMQLYFCKQGYIRTSTQVYSTDNIGNYFIHLTNNAIQKNAENYGLFENGNQLGFKKLAKYMQEQKVTEIWEKIKEITFMAFSSVKRKINFYQRRNCFELFGLDFFISHDQKVWLIQVNENPCIECSSELLGQLIPRMLNDAFKLTVDQIVDRKIIEEKVYKVDGYEDTDSLWEKLGGLAPNQDYSPGKKHHLKQNLQSSPLITP